MADSACRRSTPSPQAIEVIGVGGGVGQIVPFDSCRQHSYTHTHTHAQIITITINRTKQDNACGESGRARESETLAESKRERERPWTSVASNTKKGVATGQRSAAV